ncbi:MAG: hypothetical protein ACK6EB_15020, partial [Planctomyces sp.]|jgi:hypothetical protein
MITAVDTVRITTMKLNLLTTSLLAAAMFTLAHNATAAAGLIIRVTADPGGANQTITTFTDGDANDQDSTAGNIFLSSFAVFAGPQQTFDINSLSVSTVSTLQPVDFDVLLDLASIQAATLRLEVTVTDMDPTEFAAGGQYYADIGGAAGIFVPGMTMSYSSGYDTTNQPFSLASSVPTFNYTGPSQLFNYSATVPVSALSSPFSLSARYDFTSTGFGQDLGFNSFNEMSVPVPEPGAFIAVGFCVAAVVCRKRICRAAGNQAS